MFRVISFFAVALLAIGALAAPTPSKKLAKRSFTVPVKSRAGLSRSPVDEMVRTYSKFGWEIIVLPQNPFGGAFDGSSSSGEPVPVSSSPATTLATSAASVVATSSASEGSDAAASGTAASAAAATTTASGSSSGDVTGEVTATPEENQSEYLENVSIGGESLTLDFDTGSADL